MESGSLGLAPGLRSGPRAGSQGPERNASMIQRTFACMLLAGALLPPPGAAQTGLFGQDEPVAVPAAPTADVYAPPRPFVIGRDNLGFANFHGAIRVAGAAGNCYSMAETAKLFYDLAEYRPQAEIGDGRGFHPGEVAVALWSPAYPSVRFPVRGYGTLAETSAVPPDLELEGWVEGQVRERAGLPPRADAGTPAAEAPANGEALIGLYRLITTFHYLHYVQYQASSLVARVAEHALSVPDGVRRTTRSAIEELKHRLPLGDLGLLLIFNADPAVTFGHVVLAYRLEEGETHADIYIYDSNQQFGANRHESVLRVERSTGRFRLLRKDPETGILSPDAMYDGESWFSAAETCSLSLLPDRRLDAEVRRTLAAKLGKLEETAAYAVATGDLVRDLTQVDPSTSPLQRDLLRFVRSVQAIRARSGAPAGPTLPEDASTEDLTRWLEAHLEPGLSQALPWFVPHGIGLSGTRIVPSRNDPNRIRIETTVTLAAGAEPTAVLEALRSSAWLAGEELVAHVVEALGKAFRGAGITAWLAIEVTKGPSPSSRLGKFAPLPELVASRTVVGKLGPSDEDPPAAAHRIEIAESFVRRTFEAAMRAQGVVGVRHTFPLEVDVAGTKVGTDLVVQLDKLFPHFGYLAAWLEGAISGEVAGVRFSTPYNDYVEVMLEPTRRRNVFEVSGRAKFYLEVHGAVGWLVDVAASVIEPVFDTLFCAFAGRVEDFLQEQLETWISLVPGTRIAFHSVELETIDEGTKLSAKLVPFEVDLAATVRRIFGVDPPVVLTQVALEDDRVVLAFDAR